MILKDAQASAKDDFLQNYENLCFEDTYAKIRNRLYGNRKIKK